MQIKMGIGRIKVRYNDLEPWLKDLICNGCGGKGSFVRPPHGAEFKDFCDQHDFNYQLGGKWLRGLRLKIRADFQLTRAISQHAWETRDVKDIFWSVAYFAGISVFGFRFFNWSGDGDTINISKIVLNDVTEGYDGKTGI